MKIVYLIHQFLPEHYRGTEKFILNVVRHMQKRGHDVKVITMSFYDDTFYTKKYENIFVEEFTYKEIPIIALKRYVESWEKFTDDPGMEELAKKILMEEKPDIVHVGHTIRVAEFVTAMLQLDIPYIVTMTDFFLMCHHAVLLTPEGKLCYGPNQVKNCVNTCNELGKEELTKRYEVGKEILFGAKKLVAPSSFLGGLFKEEFPALNVEVIPYGVDNTHLKINNKTYTKSEPLVFCYAGSIDYHKGVHILLKAFSKIKYDHVALKIYGSGNDEFKKIAEGDHRIQFCGVYDESQLGDIFSGVDVLVVPSMWHENRPQVITEALACRIPVVASDAGGIEQITDGINGFTFGLGDRRGLRRTLKKIAKNPEILNQIKSGIDATVLSSAEEEAIQYEKLYGEVLKHRS